MGIGKRLANSILEIESSEQGFNPFTETYAGRMKDLSAKPGGKPPNPSNDSGDSDKDTIYPDLSLSIEEALKKIGDNAAGKEYFLKDKTDTGEEGYVLRYGTNKMQSGQEEGEWYKEQVRKGKTNLIDQPPETSGGLEQIAENIKKSGDKYIVTGEAKKHVPEDVLSGDAIIYDPFKQAMTVSKKVSRSKETRQELQGLGAAQLNYNINRLDDEYLRKKGKSRKEVKKQLGLPEKFYKD